jgi:hypothetical protein
MMTSSAPAVESTTLARDRLGVPAVLYLILSAMAPMTVAAGVVTTMYAVTGLPAIGRERVLPAAWPPPPGREVAGLAAEGGRHPAAAGRAGQQLDL